MSNAPFSLARGGPRSLSSFFQARHTEGLENKRNTSLSPSASLWYTAGEIDYKGAP